MLLLGPVLDGRALLWHAHEDAGAHLHVLAEHAHEPNASQDHEPFLASEHHQHAHEHHQGAPPSPGEHRESDCFVVSLAGPFLPGGLVLRAPMQRAQQSSVVGLAPPAPRPLAVQPSGSGPPPGRLRAKLRSGAALVVGTSHALLI